MDLTPKQQTSEAIRQAETIVILTGQHPSVDQVAAVIGLTAILRKFGKNVTPIISDNPPASVSVLDMSVVEKGLGGSRDFVLKLDVTKAEVDKLRYEVADGKLNIYLTPFKGGFAPSDVTFGYGETNVHYDLAIVLGVPTRARIDRVYEQNSDSFATIPTVNLDFHRSNENYGAVNLIEPNASSLCEMMVALSESLQSGIIDAEIATALLMGIVASTDRFTAAHTSPKSLTVAAQMMAAGAKQQAVVRALYRDGRSDARTPERTTSTSDRPAAERTERRAPERSAQPQPAPVRPQAPAAAPAQHQAQPQPQVQTQSQAPLEPQAAVMPATPVVVAEPEIIIEPGHIELSEPEAAAPASEQRPQAHPMADFAAASEMFSRVEPNVDAKPERDAS
jgi:hypothetical protein